MRRFSSQMFTHVSQGMSVVVARRDNSSDVTVKAHNNAGVTIILNISKNTKLKFVVNTASYFGKCVAMVTIPF